MSNNIKSIRIIFYFTVFYLLKTPDYSEAWRPFKFIFTKYEVVSNDKYTHIDAVIFNNTAGSTYLKAQYYVNENLNDAIMVNICVRQLRRNEGRLLRANFTVNMCEAFKKPVTSHPPIISGIYALLTTHVDMPLKCPIIKNLYNVTAFGDIEELFPPYIPLNLYDVSLIFSNKRTLEFYARTTLFLKVVLNSERRKKKPGRNLLDY